MAISKGVEHNLGQLQAPGIPRGHGRGQPILVERVVHERIGVDVGESDLHFLLCCNIAHHQPHYVSILRIVLAIGRARSLAHLPFKLFLSFLFLHDQSCVPLSSELHLKSIDSGIGVNWKDVLDIECALLRIEVDLGERDLCEGVDYLDIISEIFEWEFEGWVVGLIEGVASGHAQVLLVVLVKGHKL